MRKWSPLVLVGAAWGILALVPLGRVFGLKVSGVAASLFFFMVGLLAPLLAATGAGWGLICLVRGRFSWVLSLGAILVGGAWFLGVLFSMFYLAGP